MFQSAANFHGGSNSQCQHQQPNCSGTQLSGICSQRKRRSSRFKCLGLRRTQHIWTIASLQHSILSADFFCPAFLPAIPHKRRYTATPPPLSRALWCKLTQRTTDHSRVVGSMKKGQRQKSRCFEVSKSREHLREISLDKTREKLLCVLCCARHSVNKSRKHANNNNVASRPSQFDRPLRVAVVNAGESRGNVRETAQSSKIGSLRVQSVTLPPSHSPDIPIFLLGRPHLCIAVMCSTAHAAFAAPEKLHVQQKLTQQWEQEDTETFANLKRVPPM